jgi:hypothetical protein
MCAKGNGPIRVGCGPPEAIDAVMGWISALPYPWCRPDEAIEGMPVVADLEPVRQYLGHAQPGGLTDRSKVQPTR